MPRQALKEFSDITSACFRSAQTRRFHVQQRKTIAEAPGDMMAACTVLGKPVIAKINER